MTSEGVFSNIIRDEKVEKQARLQVKLRLVREHIKALEGALEEAKQRIIQCQSAEENALKQLQSAVDLPWHVRRPADLTVFQAIESELARLQTPLAEQQKQKLAAYKQATRDTAQAKQRSKELRMDYLITGNKHDVLTKKEADQEHAHYHRNLLKWLLFVDESFADRPDMDVFPSPPALPQGCDGTCDKQPNRKIDVCDCSVKAAFVFADGLDLGYDLRNERRRWHPEQFYACDFEERREFLEKAEEVFRVVDGLYQRKRTGLSL